MRKIDPERLTEPVLASGMGLATAGRVGVRRYQDLVAWQLANELKQKVYLLIEHSAARDDRRFCDQIRAAVSSAPANLAEGFGCYRHPEFARYARIARSSLTEAHNHLGDGIDRRYWSRQDALMLQALTDRAIGATTRLMRYLMSTEAPTYRSE